jgi:hypothetical protein
MAKRARKTTEPEREVLRGHRAAAARYEVSTRTIQEWVADGLPHEGPPRSRVFYPDVTDAWVEAHRKKGKGQEPEKAVAAKLSVLESKAEQERLRAERMAREEAAALGNVLRRDVAELYMIECVQKARDRFLRLPVNLCRHVPKKFHNALRKEGQAEVRKICEELARDFERGADEKDDE